MPPKPAPESLDPAHVLLLLDDPEARRRLTSWLGAANVDEMLSFASRDVGPDGGKRRVVILHGIMGGQLVDRRGFLDDVLWFDLPQLLYARGLERLVLTRDGLGDAAPGARLEPSRPLRVVYDVLAWHLAGVGGFRVHPLAYDWRKSIDVAADRLHAQLEALATGDVEARFSVVAHSMGGAVTLRYAMRYPEAAERRLEHVVFMGVPIAGCFEPFQLWAGTHPTAARVDRVAPGRGEVVRHVFATFPGMAELCADPRLFDSDALLHGGAWPDLPALGPWLTHARRWRSHARVPEFLLDRLDVILSADHDTCVGLERTRDGVSQRHAPGDRAVPVRSAWCEGARAHWATDTHHPMLPLDHDVRSAVVALLATRGELGGGLRRVHALAELDPGTEHAHAPGELLDDSDPTGLFELPHDGDRPRPLDALRDRSDRGEACNGDAMWLLGCEPKGPAHTPPRPERPPFGTPSDDPRGSPRSPPRGPPRGPSRGPR